MLMNKNNTPIPINKINESTGSSDHWSTSPKKEIVKNPSSSTISNTVTNSTFTSVQPEKIPTLFEWKGPNKSVYITGSFCNWKQRLKMNYIQTSSRLILGLPAGTYQYKYIVDGEWQYSKDYPIVTEQGITNNVIEVKSKANKAKQDEQQSKQSTNTTQSPIERTVIPCPDINMLPLPLSDKAKLIPQVLFNHTLVPCSNRPDMSYIALFTINRVRFKTVNMVYYKPRKANNNNESSMHE